MAYLTSTLADLGMGHIEKHKPTLGIRASVITGSLGRDLFELCICNLYGPAIGSFPTHRGMGLAHLHP